MLSKEQAEAAADALMKHAVDDRAASRGVREARARQPVAQPGDVMAGVFGALLGFVCTMAFGFSLVVAAAASLAVGVLAGVYAARRRSAK